MPHAPGWTPTVPTPTLSQINEARAKAKLRPLDFIGSLDPHKASEATDEQAQAAGCFTKES